MKVNGSSFRLKNGEYAELRCPLESEASAVLQLQRQMATETEYLHLTPEEWEARTSYWQLDKIAKYNNLPDQLMLCCYVRGAPVGICKVWFNTSLRERHRASLSLAVSQQHWRQGIGSTMLKEAIQIASARQGVTQLELTLVADNKPAYKLYRKMKFRRVARHPSELRLSDGKLHARYYMVRKL